MAKKKASGGIGEGTRVRVKPGVMSPEFPEFSLEGWTGVVTDTIGKAPALKLIVEWDDATIAKLPPDYISKCEAQQLYYKAGCLAEADVDVAI